MVPDRHARASKVDHDPRRRPSDGFRVLSSNRFRGLVEDAVAALPQRFSRPLTGAVVVVRDLPPPPMVDRDGEVVLATVDEGRLTVYRRPLEMRAETRGMLEETVMLAVAQAVSRAQGLDDDLDEFFD
ncbi:MAG: hypothetical protein GEU74_04390 [Nitriliruptorales bacterium]|nr:hypothetical protein [Nitriliruptorales bacterium]